MSQENVEVILEGVDAINRRDPDAFIACLHPDVVWEESGDVLPGLRGIYHGHSEARDWVAAAFLDVWESFHIRVTEITEATDGRVFLGTLLTARGAGSGVETELPAWSAFWFVGGKVRRRQVFFDRAEALEAAGLRESRPIQPLTAPSVRGRVA
jgi:ketosteroid isomerase-like protein